MASIKVMTVKDIRCKMSIAWIFVSAVRAMAYDVWLTRYYFE
jgi:hypothetical protein